MKENWPDQDFFVLVKMWVASIYWEKLSREQEEGALQKEPKKDVREA